MISDRDRIGAALPGYEIGAEIGRGAWGVVLAARHRQLGRGVAIKQLPDGLADNVMVQRRFTAEARVLAALDHPHIVPIFDYVEDKGLCLLVMELLPGGTVRDRFTGAGIGPEAACNIVLATCAALDYAHGTGVLHRDIKPENLLFNATGHLKVTDFGIAKVLGGAETVMTQTGQVLGTPAYMAPEQVTAGPLTPATDVYAVATMLYELLSSHLPFSDEGGIITALYRHVYEQPTPLRAVAPAVPQTLAGVVMRGLTTDPAGRYPSAEDFGVAVAEAAHDSWGPGWRDATNLNVMASKRLAQRISAPPAVSGGEAARTTQPLDSTLPESTRAPAAATAATAPTALTAPAAPPDPTAPTAPAAPPAPPGPPEPPASPVPSAPPGLPAARRWRRPALVIGLVVVAALIVVGVVARTGHHSKGRPAAPPVSPTRVVFTDNFSDRASGWAPDANQDGNGAGSYETDGYLVTGLMVLPSLNTYSVASPYIPQLMSMSVSANATIVAGAPGDGAGVRCDQGSRNGLRYTFEVFGNGQWVIFKIDQGATVLQSGNSSVIHTDGRANTIEGQCNQVGTAATSLVMTVNGLTLGSVTDSHPGGPIGWHAALVIYRSAGVQTVVRFNNFRTVADNPG